MGVNSLLKTVTRQRRGCELNPESSTLTTRLPRIAAVNYKRRPSQVLSTEFDFGLPACFFHDVRQQVPRVTS